MALTAEDIDTLAQTFHTFTRDVLGIQAEKSNGEGGGNEGETGALLDLIVEMRTQAKANKDWGTADKIRDVLAANGITIQDSKDGSSGLAGKRRRCAGRWCS